MIVPESRLLVWAGLLGISASLIAAANPAAWPLAAAGAALFLLLLILDAWLASGRLDGVAATFPEIVRLTLGREGELGLEIEARDAVPKRLRLGIAFPAAIRSPYETMQVEIGGSPRSRVSWPCVGLRRGRYFIDNVYIEMGSLLGFWAVRKTSAARAEVRVYPNAIREQRNLAGLFLNRGMFGIHAHRQVGKGREFERLREYIPGDSYEDIHWKATAKRGRPVTKIFQIERTQEVYVVIDGSRLSARRVGIPPLETTQLERFITTALVLGLVAEKQGDLFGVLLFDDQVRTFVRARSGKAHYGACRDALYTLEPRMVNPDFGEVCSFIRLRLRRRALLVFLTNLDDPVLAEQFVRNLELVASHHVVVVNMLKLPGVAPLFQDADVTLVDEIYQRLGGHIQWQKLRELEKVLKRRGVPMALLDNERMGPQLVSQYINIKRRQIL